MSGRNEQEFLFQEAARRELAQGRIDRRDFITRSMLTGLGLAGVGALAKSGVTPAFAADRPLTPTFYQWIQDLHPGIPAVNAKFPGTQLPDRPGRRLRHRALRRGSQGQAKHLGRLCRPDAVRRDVGVHQGGRHRAVGQLHPEGCDRRHHSVDPGGMHSRRQIVQLAVPPRRHRLGMAFGHHRQGWRTRRGASDLGRVSRQLEEDRRFRRPRPGARRSTRMAGGLSCQSPTA